MIPKAIQENIGMVFYSSLNQAIEYSQGIRLMAVTTHIETLETLLQQWRPSLGEDYTAYRNHVYRVINHCIIYAKKNDITLSHGDIEIIAIAGAFHDIGIWLDHTFDYLKPSLQRANNYLVREGKNQWVELVSNMITEHHKITPYTLSDNHEKEGFVEMFRQADWVDVSMGTLNFSMPRSAISEVRKVFPYAGFHRKLMQLTLDRVLKAPFSPLPMFKW